MEIEILGWIINSCFMLACALAIYISLWVLACFFLSDFGGRDSEDGEI